MTKRANSYGITQEEERYMLLSLRCRHFIPVSYRSERLLAQRMCQRCSFVQKGQKYSAGTSFSRRDSRSTSSLVVRVGSIGKQIPWRDRQVKARDVVETLLRYEMINRMISWGRAKAPNLGGRLCRTDGFVRFENHRVALSSIIRGLTVRRARGQP
jgi:hypothetical protein